jgi:hypothetical protein
MDVFPLGLDHKESLPGRGFMPGRLLLKTALDYRYSSSLVLGLILDGGAMNIPEGDMIRSGRNVNRPAKH